MLCASIKQMADKLYELTLQKFLNSLYRNNKDLAE